MEFYRRSIVEIDTRLVRETPCRKTYDQAKHLIDVQEKTWRESLASPQLAATSTFPLNQAVKIDRLDDLSLRVWNTEGQMIDVYYI